MRDRQKKFILIGASVGGILGTLTVIGLNGCQQPQYAPDSVSDQVTHQQAWEREDKNKAYDTANAGYAGGFACHTADGGCLHFTCTTEKSCTYMQAAMSKCNKPEVGNDPKALDRLLIKDGSCDTAGQDQPASITTSSGNGSITSATISQPHIEEHCENDHCEIIQVP